MKHLKSPRSPSPFLYPRAASVLRSPGFQEDMYDAVSVAAFGGVVLQLPRGTLWETKVATEKWTIEIVDLFTNIRNFPSFYGVQQCST